VDVERVRSLAIERDYVMKDSLNGAVVVVTGASRGIGAATARAFDRAGASVVLVARSNVALEAVSAEFVNPTLCVAVDLSEPTAAQTVVNTSLSEFGKIDVLVNNAGQAVRRDVEEVDAAFIDGIFAVNVRAPLLLVSSAARALACSPLASVVNVSSVAGLVGAPRRSVYAASKGALDAATRSLASELGPRGIRVNSIAPGVVETDLWSARIAIPGVIDEVEKLTPLGRLAKPEDVADAIVLLSTPSARFISGTTLSVDGGMANSIALYGKDG